MSLFFRHTPWRGLALAVAASLLLLSGCGSSPRRPQYAGPSLQEIARGGYQSEAHFATRTLHEIWRHDDTPLDISLVAPNGDGPFPLIVYLPGLGESANAGALWRNAWAAAGYAVLAMQPHALGQSVWESDRARNGDFHGIAREKFAAAALDARLKLVNFVLAETQRRARNGAAGFSTIDVTRIALAGYDLGAQTVMAVCGEATPATVHVDIRNIRAAIVLSPYVDLAAGGLETRYAAIALPVLSITGTDDADAYDLVSTPAVRRAPWQYMPAGDKYLLLLEGGIHRALAGTDETDTDDPGENSSGASENSRDRGGNSFMGSTATSGMALDQAEGKHRRGNNPGGKSASELPGVREQHAFNVRHIAAIQSVSTAFLDMILKHDAIAREWLARNGNIWLKGSATLQGK